MSELRTFSELSTYITGKPSATLGECGRKLSLFHGENIKIVWHALGLDETITIYVKLDELDEPMEWPQRNVSFPMTEEKFENELSIVIADAECVFDSVYGLGDKEW